MHLASFLFCCSSVSSLKWGLLIASDNRFSLTFLTFKSINSIFYYSSRSLSCLFLFLFLSFLLLVYSSLLLLVVVSSSFKKTNSNSKTSVLLTFKKIRHSVDKKRSVKRGAFARSFFFVNFERPKLRFQKAKLLAEAFWGAFFC